MRRTSGAGAISAKTEPATGASAPVRTPTRRYEARRSAILASAVDVLNRKGLRGMTLGEVAAKLGLVPTGVIYYFRNKEELAAACYLRAIARYEALLETALRETTPRTRIAAFTAAFFAFKAEAEAGAAEQIAVFNDMRALNAPAVNEPYQALFRAARALLESEGGRDAMPRLHRNGRTHLLLAELFWAVAWLKDFEPADYGRAATRATSILADGLAAPGVSWPAARPLDLTHADDPAADASSELFLRAATELINAEGYHGASVERISARLKVSKGAFYHHNETKDELVMACFQRAFDRMWRAIRAAEAAGGRGLEVLVSVSCALVDLHLRGGAPLLRTSAITTVPETLQPELLARFDRISHRFASIISDGVADGSIRPVDVNVAAQMITGMINAAAELHYFTPGLAPEAAADHYVKPFFQGLLSPADQET